eukprot:CAMPEP_0201590728 /NCGR_PEP_ID=MMETSP0190_2-20130828/181195_1 /ASSEMBLY_ACC=CAM_ASM_000263 /TAXON_ID=37353 /ORGANISM="Rosalina sp." /LENGTH=87 /DNA_ID=CAMNT_0048047489 /DNA_START=172 /DNA_END=436 /DNA_ORIENTATION=-
MHDHASVPKYDMNVHMDHGGNGSSLKANDCESESKHEKEFTHNTNTDQQIEGGSTHPQDLSDVDYVALEKAGAIMKPNVMSLSMMIY